MNETSFPLSWPAGWKRTETGWRKRANFCKKDRIGAGSARKERLNVSDAVRRLLQSLKAMGIPDWNVIISTNVELRRDGLPYSGRKAPEDPGAAVYWQDGPQRRCMAIDQYDRVEDNLAALAATLDAMRAIERHGGAAILDRAFTGFTALEFSPEGARSRTWRDVLFPNGCPADVSIESAKANHRRLAMIAHPDRGGTHEAMSDLNAALAEAERELRP
jgi:hypothetical protein